VVVLFIGVKQEAGYNDFSPGHYSNSEDK